MINKIFRKITDRIDFNNSSQTIFYVNVYSYKILRKYPKIVNSADYFTLDGIILVLFIRFFYDKKIKRMSPDFSSYIKGLFNFLNDKKKKVSFIGGSKQDLKIFCEIIRGNYPSIQITACNDGYDLDEEEAINTIIANKIDFVFVGMGTPKQELFIIKMRERGYKGSCVACGAFLGQTAAKGVQYYPNIIDKLELRWLYRIYKEPKLIKRYFIYYPVAMIYLIVDRLK